MTLAFANGKVPPPSIRVFTTAGAQRLYLKLFPAANNGFYVVWNSSTPQAATMVYGQAFDTWGNVLGSQASLWTGPVDQPELWDAVADQKSGFFLSSVESGVIQLQHIGVNGQRVWKQTLTPVVAGPTQITDAAMAKDDQGGFYLAWIEVGPLNQLLWAQHWNAAGQPLWPGHGVRPGPQGQDQSDPTAINDGVGGLIVAWKSFITENAMMRTQRITNDGRLLWPPLGIDIHPAVGDLRKNLFLAAPGKGGVVGAWTQGVSGLNRIFFQHVGATGERTWGASGITMNPPTDEQWNPILLGNGQGSLWIIWEEIIVNAPQKLILTRRDPPTGDRWPPGEINIASTPGAQGRPWMELDGSGGVMIAWIDNRTDIGIYLQDVAADGTLRYGDGLLMAGGLRRAQRPHLLLLPNHRAVVAWAEELGGDRWYLKRAVLALP